MHRTIVCLANSRRSSGHCIVGKEIAAGRPGGWIRAVSGRPSRELKLTERAYKGMVEPSVLDMIELPLADPLPEDHEVENRLIVPEIVWKCRGKLAYADLAPFVDTPSRLWENRLSSRAGKNDRMTAADAARHRGSVYFLRLPWLNVRVGIPPVTHGRAVRKVFVDFVVGDEEYSFPMADPRVEKAYLSRGDGDYLVEDTYMTVCLSEPFAGYCHKLAASLIPPDGAGSLDA